MTKQESRRRGKGIRKGQPGRPTTATQPTPRFDRLHGNEPVAIDIEFQYYTITAEPMRYSRSDRLHQPQHERIGRISIVNLRGETVFDTFVNYENGYPAVKFAQFNRFNGSFGVTIDDLESWNGARKGREVEAEVLKIIKDRPIVFWGPSNDIKTLYHEGVEGWDLAQCTIDVQYFYDNKPNLGDAAQLYLDGLLVQQGGQHDCLEDAQTTMKLYQKWMDKEGFKDWASWDHTAGAKSMTPAAHEKAERAYLEREAERQAKSEEQQAKQAQGATGGLLFSHHWDDWDVKEIADADHLSGEQTCPEWTTEAPCLAGPSTEPAAPSPPTTQATNANSARRIAVAIPRALEKRH